MRIPVINNQNRFQEDYGTPEDAEDALLEMCDHIESYEDGDHTISGRTVYFWFTATMTQTDMQLTYHSRAHHY